MNLNSNMHSPRGRWERGRSPVGGDCYHTILNLIFTTKLYIDNLLEVGAMAIAPYSFSDIKSLSAKLYFIPSLLNGALENSTLRNFFKIQKYYDLTCFSQKLFFNVKILKIV